MSGRSARAFLLGVFLAGLAAAGCTSGSGSADVAGAAGEATGDRSGAASAGSDPESDGDSESEGDSSPDESSTTTEPPPPPTVEVRGTVVAAGSGAPLPNARVTSGEQVASTTADGSFVLPEADPSQPLVVDRPVWQAATVDDWSDGPEPLVVELEPFVVRGLRVSRYAAMDPAQFDELLTLADQTSVNALVFDTKDESDTVLYDTDVDFAHEIGAVQPVYDPTELLAEARERGLYAVTRIVTFEDTTWARAKPEAKLAGHWVDAADRTNWQYPLDLAVEACRLGFDEIQFDYVRFPAGRTAEVARSRVPPTSAERADTIAEFLGQARELLHDEGCGVSAAIFGIVMSSETDEGIGQTPEAASAEVDALSPMLYPSHYSPGWLGFADPNSHPGPVIAHALDTGAPKVAETTLMRPWIQGFGYGATNVMAQIDEAEARGAGWIIWNASGSYRRDWLPPS